MMNGCDSEMESGNKAGDVWDVAAQLLKPILHGVFKMPPTRLLSHYKLDAKKDRLLTVSCSAEDMLLPRSNFIFSGAMTAVCGITPMITALSVNPNKVTSQIYLLPRFPKENGDRDWRVPVEAPSQLWLLHVGNAYQNLDQDGNLEMQIQACACSYQWFNFHKLFGYDWQTGKLDPSIMNIISEGQKGLPHLIQVSIRLDANGVCQKCKVEPLNQWDKSSDFPVINPAFSGRKNTYIYAAASSGSRPALPHFPFDMVAKLNVSNKLVRTWSVGSRRFVGEPIFIPNGAEEDDGYPLAVEFQYAVSVQRCYLVILDPKRIGEADHALVARLEVPKHLNFPLGFHGFWRAADK
ncbi:hypothetical protein FNV43_RR18340 [Rhamnella rubrinervis]|uniref:Uncharacterized protein n=1 Tax=Rhamnella rubrinervis TaxID=2594499 RepID=A0A8K0EAX9_9ROSA|nr:hypothetical protein FNV43_RR18340 [Rhamnella rubrinervis]